MSDVIAVDNEEAPPPPGALGRGRSRSFDSHHSAGSKSLKALKRLLGRGGSSKKSQATPSPQLTPKATPESQEIKPTSPPRLTGRPVIDIVSAMEEASAPPRRISPKISPSRLLPVKPSPPTMKTRPSWVNTTTEDADPDVTHTSGSTTSSDSSASDHSDHSDHFDDDDDAGSGMYGATSSVVESMMNMLERNKNIGKFVDALDQTVPKEEDLAELSSLEADPDDSSTSSDDTEGSETYVPRSTWKIIPLKRESEKTEHGSDHSNRSSAVTNIASNVFKTPTRSSALKSGSRSAGNSPKSAPGKQSRLGRSLSPGRRTTQRRLSFPTPRRKSAGGHQKKKGAPLTVLDPREDVIASGQEAVATVAHETGIVSLLFPSDDAEQTSDDQAQAAEAIKAAAAQHFQSSLPRESIEGPAEQKPASPKTDKKSRLRKGKMSLFRRTPVDNGTNSSGCSEKNILQFMEQDSDDEESVYSETNDSFVSGDSRGGRDFMSNLLDFLDPPPEATRRSSTLDEFLSCFIPCNVGNNDNLDDTESLPKAAPTKEHSPKTVTPTKDEVDVVSPGTVEPLADVSFVQELWSSLLPAEHRNEIPTNNREGSGEGEMSSRNTPPGSNVSSNADSLFEQTSMVLDHLKKNFPDLYDSISDKVTDPKHEGASGKEDTPADEGNLSSSERAPETPNKRGGKTRKRRWTPIRLKALARRSGLSNVKKSPKRADPPAMQTEIVVETHVETEYNHSSELTCQSDTIVVGYSHKTDCEEPEPANGDAGCTVSERPPTPVPQPPAHETEDEASQEDGVALSVVSDDSNVFASPVEFEPFPQEENPFAREGGNWIDFSEPEQPPTDDSSVRKSSVFLRRMRLRKSSSTRTSTSAQKRVMDIDNGPNQWETFRGADFSQTDLANSGAEMGTTAGSNMYGEGYSDFALFDS